MIDTLLNFFGGFMKKIIFSFLICMAILNLTACGSSSNSSSSYSQSDYNYADVNVNSSNGINMAFNTADIKNSNREVEPIVEETEINNISNRKLIRTVRASLEITDNKIDEVSFGLIKSVENLGGYVESNDINNNSTSRQVDLILRVPENSVDDILNMFNNEFITLKSLSDNKKDVTLKYVDTEANLRVLRTQQEKMEGYLKEAKTIEELLSVERRLQDVLVEIERVESEFKSLNNSIEYSTITINIRQSVYDTTSFFGKLGEEVSNISDDIQDEIINIICFILMLLPIVIFGGIVILLGIKLYQLWDKLTFEKREKRYAEKRARIEQIRKDAKLESSKLTLKVKDEKNDINE